MNISGKLRTLHLMRYLLATLLALPLAYPLAACSSQSEGECVQQQCLNDNETFQFCSDLVADVCAGTRGLPADGENWLKACGDETGAHLCE